MIRSLTNRLLIAGLLTVLAPTCASMAQDSQSDFHHEAHEDTIEAKNTALIMDFYDEFFNKHDLNEAKQLIREDYIQHNLAIATGREAFIDVFQGLFQKTPHFHLDIKHLGAEGDFVWVQTHRTDTPTDLGLEIIDIYRIQGGKIAEHWDTIVPVSASPVNTNTQF